MNELKNKFDINGYCVARELFTKSEILKLESNIEKHIKKNLYNFKPREINIVNGKPNSVHNFRNNKYFDDLANNTKIINIVSELLNSKSKVKAMEYFAKPKKFGLASPPHQDNFYWCFKRNLALTMWISLDYSNRKNGSVFYYNKSHKLGLLQHQNSYAPGSSQTIKKKAYSKLSGRRTFIELKPGDCLFHHCLVVHGSEKNISNKDRRGMVIQYNSCLDSIDKKKLSQYTSNLQKQIKARKK